MAGFVHDPNEWMECDRCGHRIARWMGTTDDGSTRITLKCCNACKYVLKENIVALSRNVEGDPCAEGATKQDASESQTEAGDRGMLYVLDHQCTGCGRVFTKLVGSAKTNDVYVPGHKAVGELVPA